MNKIKFLITFSLTGFCLTSNIANARITDNPTNPTDSLEQTGLTNNIVGQIDTTDSIDLFDSIDSLDVALKKLNEINDYSMIGIQFGMGFSRPSWNPHMEQTSLKIPYNFGITYTRYGKMFGYMPYFGFQLGVFYGQEGYKFVPNDQGNIANVEGATKAVMDVIEVPFMAHCHFDFWKLKLMVNLGLYGGYRLSIHRYGENVDPEIADSFIDTDIRFDYGIKAGAGFAVIIDPIEIHLTASYKYAFSSLYQPDYYSKYYYRYSYPTNIVISLGVHFQLTKRTGMTRHELKRTAKERLGLINTIGETFSSDKKTADMVSAEK